MPKQKLPGDLPSAYDELSPEQKHTLEDWIAAWLIPGKKINKSHTSYGLKHYFEASERGFYISNGQFKGAMLALGFRADDPESLNWCFNITVKSMNNLKKLHKPHP